MTPRPPLKLASLLTFAIIAIALTFAIYWTGLSGGFFFDDDNNFRLNAAVRLDTLSTESLRQTLNSGIAGPLGRPVSQLSFALNYYSSGFDPFAFKLTNLVIHALNGILLFFITLQLLKTSTAQRHGPLFAGIVVLAWLIHPLQLTSVLYVVQRMTSLSAFFLLAALLLHLQSRERGGHSGATGLFVAWCVLWPLSFLSKESGLLFPLFVLACELILRRGPHQKLDLFAHGLAIATSLAAAAGAVYCFWNGAEWLLKGYDLRSFSLTERVLTEGRVLCFYVGLIVFPRLDALALHHDDFLISTGPLSPWTTLPALFFLVTLMGCAWHLRQHRPLISFGITWFLIGHLLESTILPLELVHEHRNYLAIFGILIAGTDILMLSTERRGTKRNLSLLLAAIFLIYSAFITAIRAHQFGDPVRLALTEAEYHPESSRSQYEAGRTLELIADSSTQNAALSDSARKHYEQASRLNPNSKLGVLGLLHMDCKAKKGTSTALVQELARRLNTPPFAPGDRNILLTLNRMMDARTLCLTRTDMDGLYAAALTNPSISQWIQSILHSWHADYLWLHEHDLSAAQTALSRSLTLDPSNPGTRLKWAQLLYVEGKREDAKQQLLELRDSALSPGERGILTELLGTLQN